MIKKILDLTLKLVLGTITFLIYATLLTLVICSLSLLFKIAFIGSMALGLMMSILLIGTLGMLYDLGNSVVKNIKIYLKRKGF